MSFPAPQPIIPNYNTIIIRIEEKGGGDQQGGAAAWSDMLDEQNMIDRVTVEDNKVIKVYSNLSPKSS